MSSTVHAELNATISTSGKDTATHRMPSTGSLARAGANGQAELWAWGRWVESDHANCMLSGDYPHWFQKL